LLLPAFFPQTLPSPPPSELRYPLSSMFHGVDFPAAALDVLPVLLTLLAELLDVLIHFVRKINDLTHVIPCFIWYMSDVLVLGPVRVSTRACRP
jgi:hypothetical protein